MQNCKHHPISDTSPGAESVVAGSSVSGLSHYDHIQVYAALVGATGGTLDVYLQRKVNATWVDWAHFTQLASGAPAVKYSFSANAAMNTVTDTNRISTIGVDLTPALGSGVIVGGHPGDEVRAVYDAGSSTSEGAAVSIVITGTRPK